jgi:hypothetical protein
VEGIYRAFVATNNQYVGTPELHISYIPAPPPVLDAWPGNLSARAASTVAEGAASLNVGNVTYGTLAWTASIVGTPSSWLTLNQTGGSATPTNPGTVTFSVDATGLTPGTYTEQIQISSGTPDVENTPLITTFTLEVLDSLNTVYLPAVIGGGGGGSSSVAPQTVAVIVGVADYYYLGSAPNSGNLTDEWGYDLNEPVHDATKMANLAQTYWNVQPEDLTQLTDSSANRDDIMAALTAAAGKMCPGTTASAAATQAVCPNTRFIFYYSGHGGQTLDDNSDESDGYDEFIAAYDTNVVSGTFTSIITDDDLEEMLAAIPAEQIVVIIDSCYSGSMVTTTTAETETGATLLRRGLVNPYQPDTPAETNALSELAAPNRLVITGGTGDELTWESGELEDGVFTYFLMQGVTDSLNDANGNGRISAEEAYWFSHDLVDDWVFKNTGDHQNPAIYDQIWGQIDLTAVP